MRKWGAVQLGTVPLQGVLRKLPRSTGGEQGISLCLAPIVDCISCMAVDRGYLVPSTGRRCIKGNEVHFPVGDEGSIEDHGVQICLDFGRDGPSHSNKSEAKVVSNLV